MRGVTRTILVLLSLLLPAASLHAGISDAGRDGYTLYPEGVTRHLQSRYGWYGESMLLAGIATGSAKTTEKKGADEEDLEAFGLESEYEETESRKVFDPLSGYNRFMTQVNDRLYFWVLKPVARGYGAVLPQQMRLSVSRFFKNLLMPVRFVNNLLQFKLKRAGTELARFTLNSTVGVLGFGDPAQKWFDLQPSPEDFGQTLGHYGVGGGFHLVLPVFGPSNLRDTLGKVPDYFLNPLNYISEIDRWETELAAKSVNRVNDTSLRIGQYESIKKDAIDLYTFLRDAYEQRRKENIEE